MRIPQDGEDHKSRWPYAPLWADVLAMIDEWSMGYEAFARRNYHFNPDLSAAYLRSFAGWVSGLQARLGVDLDADGPASLARGLSRMYEEMTPDEVDENARKKWALFSRLKGGQPSDD